MVGVTSFLRPVGLIAAALAFAASMSAASAASEANMRTGSLTSQPIGHYEFCKSLPQECNVRSRDVPAAKLSPQLWRVVVDVNHKVNEQIKPMTDMDMYGKEEFWVYPTTVGDCEDYVLLKRRMLMEAGISPANLLITVVRKRDGEGHAVLTLRTDGGDYILDNLADEVLAWTDTDYTYLKRQSTGHTGRWVTIQTPADLLVGSVQD